MTNPALEPIMDLARAYARARDDMEDVVEDIADRRRHAVRSRLKALRGRVAECAAAREALTQAIEAAPGLFERPRTQTIDGVKFGFRKQQGAIEIADEEEIVKRIRKKLPAREQALVRVKTTVDKTALRKLTAGELAKLGLSVEDPVDEVTITVPKTAIDKLVDALMEEAGEENAE